MTQVLVQRLLPWFPPYLLLFVFMGMGLCIRAHECSAHGGQQRASDLPELERQLVVHCLMHSHMGTKPPSSA